jgi:SAM-dependent methyltransferase
VVTHRDKRGGRWDVEEFLETGARHIADVIAYVDALGIPVGRRLALDFGCGVGRLTQALASHFQEVWGVDIASSMIERAQTMNRHGNRCRYFLNGADHLGLFAEDTFDFVYSHIVLQHMRPVLARRYIREFLRVLSPQGLLIFQLPSAELPRQTAVTAETGVTSRGIKGTLKGFVPPAWVAWYWERPWARSRALRALTGAQFVPDMELHGIVREEVELFLARCGGEVVDVVPNRAVPEWVGFRYAVVKARPRP